MILHEKYRHWSEGPGYMHTITIVRLRPDGFPSTDIKMTPSGIKSDSRNDSLD